MKTIFWASDSTVSNKRIDAFPEMGIGQVFDYYLRGVSDGTEGALESRVFVENHALNGRSTKSFIADGRLAAMAERMRPGDFMFIQFGHNDEKIDNPERYANPTGEYPQNLLEFLEVARGRQVTPVILSPIVRRVFDEAGNLGPQTHAAYADAARQVAAEQNVAFIDLFGLSGELLVAVGPEVSKQWFMHLAPGEFPNYPDGLTDNTHLRLPGALAFGGLIAKGLRNFGGSYADLIAKE